MIGQAGIAQIQITIEPAAICPYTREASTYATVP